jgi:poly(3-hydroxybutyrate) depolymerase
MPASRRTFGAAVVALVVTGTSARGHAAGPMAGTTERQLVVGGVTRKYLLHAGGEPKPGRPLVLVLHGWRGSAPGIARRTKGTFDRLADRDGAVVVYPQALGDPRWNDGSNVAASATPPDDLGFLSAVVDALAAEFMRRPRDRSSPNGTPPKKRSRFQAVRSFQATSRPAATASHRSSPDFLSFSNS